MNNARFLGLTIAFLIILAGFYLAFRWLNLPVFEDLTLRIPSSEKVEGLKLPEETGKKIEAGGLIKGAGIPSEEKGSWPKFRGPAGDGTSAETGLIKKIPPAGLPILWRVKTGEGYAGPVINMGRVYLIDYDKEAKQDSIRCLSFKTGEEIWKYNYPVKIKRNHGISRTVPAVNDKYLVTISPMCQVTCLKAATGEMLWKKDLVKEFGTKVPEWYAGQCPIIEGDKVILAPGGSEVLLIAVELATGKITWTVKNPGDYKMTHSSVAILDFKGERQYIYCATQGVVSVSAKTGEILWLDPTWKINIANVPTPVIVDTDKILFTGGYDAGAKYVQVVKDESEGKYKIKELFKVKASVFSSQQHTPVYYQGSFYGVIQDGQLACVDQAGKQLWKSGGEKKFGLGPFFIADGMLLVLNDTSGYLYLVEAGTGGYNEFGKAKVFNGHEAWAPMALADGKLILKDLTELVCVRLKP